MKTAIAEKTVPVCQSCTGLVKPDIVFFGEQLPSAFFDNSLLVEDADLAIIMGTSLTVHPFASLPSMVAEHVPRVLVNQERVGGLGSRRDDVLLLEQCDDGVRRLARALGWEEELEELWGKTAPEGGALPGEKEVQKTEDERLQDEIDLITKEVEENLRLSKAQKEWVEKHVGDTPKASDSQAQPDGKENERGEAKGRSAASAAAAAAGIPESETVLHEPRQDEKKRQSQEGSGLAHVFPFLNKL
jgi:NAD-dependent histone deacetylase SIR2